MKHHWHSDTTSANSPGKIRRGTVPTYQYACTACGDQLEAVQSFTDEPLTECPACQGRLRKLFGSVGIVFKGSGFYRNDSRDSSNGSRKGSESGDSAAKSSINGTGDTSSNGGSTASGGSANGGSANGGSGSSGGTDSAAKSGGSDGGKAKAGSAGGTSPGGASTGGSTGTATKTGA
jgi:putative FmdB family regulatory protein